MDPLKWTDRKLFRTDDVSDFPLPDSFQNDFGAAWDFDSRLQLAI